MNSVAAVQRESKNSIKIKKTQERSDKILFIKAHLTFYIKIWIKLFEAVFLQFAGVVLQAW